MCFTYQCKIYGFYLFMTTKIILQTSYLLSLFPIYPLIATNVFRSLIIWFSVISYKFSDFNILINRRLNYF